MTSNDHDRELHLFASFDLANATEFKYHHANWIELYTNAFASIEKALDKVQCWEYWKTNGDEILFYRAISQADSVDQIVLEVDTIMADCIETVHRQFAKYNDIQLLSVKLTMWIANIEKANSGDMPMTAWNDFEVNFDGAKDFMGKETDIGFRISKFTPRSKTSLSAALVYYLIKRKARILRNIRIAGYQRLKGVWGDKWYPILWFFRARSTQSIVRSFHYDEKWDNELISGFLDNLMRDPNHGKIEIAEFENILKYLGLKTKYDEAF